MHKKEAVWAIAWWPHFLPSGIAGRTGPRSERYKKLVCGLPFLKFFNA